MARVPHFQYIAGAELPDINFWFTENKVVLDLNGVTGQVDVYDRHRTLQFTKTTDISCQTGSGTESAGSPNCRIIWTSELDALTAGLYSAFLTLTYPSGKPRRKKFVLEMLDDT